MSKNSKNKSNLSPKTSLSSFSQKIRECRGVFGEIKEEISDDDVIYCGTFQNEDKKFTKSPNLAKIRDFFGSLKEEPATVSVEDEISGNKENNSKNLTIETNKGAESCKYREELNKKKSKK